MSWIEWIGMAVIVWCAASLGVALIVGAVIRLGKG